MACWRVASLLLLQSTILLHSVEGELYSIHNFTSRYTEVLSACARGVATKLHAVPPARPAGVFHADCSALARPYQAYGTAER